MQRDVFPSYSVSKIPIQEHGGHGAGGDAPLHGPGHGPCGAVICAIRFEGYPETVRTLTAAIYGGTTIEVSNQRKRSMRKAA